MKLSTAKRRINKTLDELCKSVVDDWYANFKNGYIKGYEDARQGKSPMYAEAYKIADTPQTEKTDRIPFDPLVEMDIKRMVEARLNQTETQNSNLTFEITDCPWKGDE